MTNVVPFQSRPAGTRHLGAATARDTGALIADLVAIAERIRTAGEDASGLPYPRLQIERTVQSLLDAISAVEQAAGTLTNDDPRLSF